ncbi:MAG TPA: membrane protein insertion efficiency factor YidD [Flexilinea sp.]|jgi:hypothetical protein|nr:membrane protein insertion efficiency factor YidD [Flexilinea sp.]
MIHIAQKDKMIRAISSLFRRKESDCSRDAYAGEPRLSELPFRISNLPRFFFLILIRIYQNTISKLLPANTCRFYPSCSHYAYQAIYKYGAFKGVPMAIWRVLRCNPFNPGGFDPVP